MAALLPAKQIRGSTFTNAEVDRVFAATSIDAGKLNLLASGGLKDVSDELAVEPADFAGAGLKDDGSDNLAIDSANGAAVTFSGTTVWTFPVDTLQVTGTPDSANDAVNKAYVDSVATGLGWKAPVDTKDYLGNRTITQINALSPILGETIVATDAGTPTAGTSDALVAGSVAEFDGTSWKEIVAGSGGFVADGVKLHVHDTGTLFSPLTDATDETKIAEFDGTSLTPTLTAPTDGDARLVIGDGSVNANRGYVFDTATTTWVQFTGASTALAGAGMTASGNVFNIVAEASADGAAVTVNADDIAIDGDIINIDYAETNYTPAITGTGVDVNDLAAHLEGIDNALGTISAAGAPQQESVTTEVITGTDTAITDTLNATPTSNAAVKLFLNGILQKQGATFDYTISGTTITWLASSGTAVDMDTADELIAVYES